MGGRRGGRGSSHNGGNNNNRNQNNDRSHRNGNNNNNNNNNSNHYDGNKNGRGNGKKRGSGADRGGRNNSDMHNDELGLSQAERKQLSANIKHYWKEGYGPDDIAYEMGEDHTMCPYKWRSAPNKLRKLTDAITEQLKREKLTNYKGQPLPSRWPENLQDEIASLFLDSRSPEDISKSLKHHPDYPILFQGWNWDSIAAAIGHFIHTNDMHAVSQGTYVPGYTDSNDWYGNENDIDLPEDWTNDDSHQILDRVVGEDWAQTILDNRRQTQYNPNYVYNQYAFTNKDSPKWGDPSRIVVRQAGPHDPMAPDPHPDPVRPVANAELYPRKCQGTHGCSRYCTWNRDFRRADGWSQHNFNNKYGMVMYLSEKEDKTIFEDAEGDVVMADNWPPWMVAGQDEGWTGSAVFWSKCLSTMDGAEGWGMVDKEGGRRAGVSE